MHVIKINRLTLENFKCHKYLGLCFSGTDATIYGDNAAGKTSVYDGLTWLLFGKDSLGNTESKIDIKPLDAEGNVRDHQAITSVEAELEVDGSRKILKRSLREKWSTRRGSSQAVYDGNESDFAIDGVPMKKQAFDAAVKELVPEDIFRMLTSVDYMPAQMPWQKRRAVLFDMAGTLSDLQIMEQDPQFLPLIQGMGSLDLTSYRAKLQAERKGFAGTRDEAPARLSELQKTLDALGSLDFEAARTERENLSGELVKVKGEILAIDHDKAVEDLRMEIRSLDQDIRELDTRNEEFRRVHDQTGALLERRKAVQQEEWMLQQKQHALSFRQAEVTQAQEHNRRIDQRIAAREQELDRDLARLRGEWTDVSKLTFEGGKCPTCGQELPADQLLEAMQHFRTEQSRKLETIQDNAALLKQERENLRALAQYAEVPTSEELQGLAAAVQDQQARVEAAQAHFREAESTLAAPADMEGYGQQRQLLLQKREELNRQMTDLVMGSGNRRAELQHQVRELEMEIQKQDQILARSELLAVTQQRMDQIREEQRNATVGLEAIDRMLYLMEEFVRFKAQFVESGINRLFRLATWRLFREQANGGMEERCDAQYDGVPYGGLNNGMRINVGIDIINALSRFYGVQVPLFIDNAESVTRLETCDSQTIRLVVSEKDKELRLA